MRPAFSLSFAQGRERCMGQYSRPRHKRCFIQVKFRMMLQGLFDNRRKQGDVKSASQQHLIMLLTGNQCLLSRKQNV